MTQVPMAPMAGIKVLDLATFIAAPYAASVLSEFGAEVIKIEHPDGGDPWRRFGTPTDLPDQSLAWLSEARNKRSVTLDLRSAEGADLFKRLVAETDVICENFRPGTLEKWGLGFDVLQAINPGIIMLRVSGYGQDGPYRDRPGFARVGHAVGGLTYLSGMPGEVPVTPGSTSLGDYMSGLYGAIGILMALRHRDATGRGQIVDMALFESVFRALDEIAPRYAMTGHVREAEGTGTINACPHGHFRCADGAYIAIACSSDKMFARLCDVMSRPDLLQDFGDQTARLAARETVNEQVGAWIESLSRDDVISQCVAGDVPAGPINTIADIFNDPQFAARGVLQTLALPELGDVVVPGPLPHLSETPGEIRSLGPVLGEANSEILGGRLGLSDNQLADLKSRGII